MCKDVDVRELMEVLKRKYENLYLDSEYIEDEELTRVYVSDNTIYCSDEFNEIIGGYVYKALNSGKRFNAYFVYDEKRFLQDVLRQMTTKFAIDTLKNLSFEKLEFTEKENISKKLHVCLQSTESISQKSNYALAA